MDVVSLLLTGVGAPAATLLLKWWLKGDDAVDIPVNLGEGVGKSLLKIAADKIKDVLGQNKAKREFENLGEKIATKLLPLFEESTKQGNCDAKKVIDELQFTLGTKPTPGLLVKENLDPARIAAEMRARHQIDATRFTAAERELYEMALDQLVRQLVYMAAALPKFRMAVATESLERVSRIGDDLDRVLETVQRIEQSVVKDSTDAAARYETRQRVAVIKKVDYLERTAPMEKIRVLFLAASPKVLPLSLDWEIREITAKIRTTEHRDSLEVISRWAVRPDDLQQALLEHQPHVLHFSGHGTISDELVLLDGKGDTKPVSKAALVHLLGVLKDNLRLVVLNACFSQPQAEAITQVIDCAVGMNRAVGDETAIKFAAAFYRAIGFGRSIQTAFDLGRSALMLDNIPEESTPQLLARTGVDPARIVLIQGQNTRMTAIEFTIDRPIEEFSEAAFKLALQRAIGIDAKLIRISSIRSGSTIVRVEANADVLELIVHRLQESQATLHLLAQLCGLQKLEWSVDGTRYVLAVDKNIDLAADPLTHGGGSGGATTHGSSKALDLWRQKLAYLEEQEAIASDPAQKFAIRNQIEEVTAKIKQLDG